MAVEDQDLVEAYRAAAAERALQITEIRREHRRSFVRRAGSRALAPLRRAGGFVKRVAKAVLRHPLATTLRVGRRARRALGGVVRTLRKAVSPGVRGRIGRALSSFITWLKRSRLLAPLRIARSVVRGPQPSPPVWVGRPEVAPRFQRLNYSYLVRSLGDARPVTVVVPVYGGADHVDLCLQSLLRWTPEDVKILVLDDASPDEETQAVLARRAASPRITVIRRSQNLGYTQNVNAGLHDAGDDDVVLLNSDTVVGPLWLQRLRWAAYSQPKVAAVSAVSDNAGAMAVPLPGQFNDWSNRWGWTNASRAAARHARHFVVDTPTAHGFCMYMRREAIDDVGGFDAEHFPRGYGEENDWSMRARREGWAVSIAPHVLVRHAQGQSFGSARAELIAQAREVMNTLHPTYSNEVRALMEGRAMREVRLDATRALAAAHGSRQRPRVLSVIHIAGGGTPQTNRELLDALADDQDAWIVEASPKIVRLQRVSRGGWSVVDEWTPSDPFTFHDTWRPDYAAWLARWLVDLGIETIHVRHLINQPLETVPEVARRLGIPVILSTHDFYMVCPTINLMDGAGQYCGGVCTPDPRRCYLPSGFVADARDLKRGGVETWRSRTVPVMLGARAVIATTETAAEVHRRIFPEVVDRLRIIEHGRPFAARSTQPWRETSPRRPGPLRIFCAANWAPHKGGELVAQLVERTSPYIEWHLAGKRSEAISPQAIAHGEYIASELADLVEGIDPDLAGIFSLVPETYSQTLSEAWGFGLPVIATRFGAVAERIERHGGGVLVDADDVEGTASLLLDMAYRVLRGEAPGAPAPTPHSLRSVQEMAADYRALYRGQDRLAHIAIVTSNGAGAPYVRLQSRASRLVDDDRAYVMTCKPDRLEELVRTQSLDAMIVQRDALIQIGEGGVLDEARKRGVRIVAEIDDDLITRHAESVVDIERVEATRVLIEKADAVITSTEALGSLVKEWRGASVDLAVMPNLVDDGVWGAVPPEITRGEPRRYRWVYWGTESHVEDLELLREAFTSSGSDAAIHELDVIGITTASSSWYNVIPVPPGTDLYPQFARWLRETAVAREWRGGLAPLKATPFNDAKSDLKALEYAMLGLPCLVGDVEPYRHLARYGVPLVADDPAAWAEAIAGASRGDWDASQSEFLAYVREHRTLSSQGGLEAWLEAVLGRAVPRR